MNFEVTLSLSLREKVKRALQEYQLVPEEAPAAAVPVPDDDDEEDDPEPVDVEVEPEPHPTETWIH